MSDVDRNSAAWRLRSRLKRFWHDLSGQEPQGEGTWWDNRDPKRLRDKFLRDQIQGVNHPSRRWMRQWLRSHPGMSLLDIPCGPGVEYEGIKQEKVPVTYTGMDFSDSMLQAVKQRFPEIDVRKGSILEIPLADRSMDVVLCRHILEHLDDYHPAVREAARVARKHVFIVLFRIPSHLEKKHIGYGAYDNRLDWNELESYLKSLDLKFTATRLPYDYPVPAEVEENTVIQIDL